MNRIKEMRKIKKLTVAELASEIGISQSMLSNYENGNSQPRDQEVWKKLANIFDVPVAYLMGLTDIKEYAEDVYGNGKMILNELITDEESNTHISVLEIAKRAKMNKEKIKKLEDFLKDFLDREPTENEIYGILSFLDLNSNELKSNITSLIQNINLIEVSNQNSIEHLENEVKKLKNKETN